MILVDTSIWVDHLRAGNEELARLLGHGLVAMHPFVTGELACGSLVRRQEILSLLRSLHAAPVATSDEVLEFIEARRLMGRGIGLIDVHLLASCALGGHLRLWTHERRLASVATELGLAHG